MNKKLAQLRQSGFTLVELLIVIALIGILSVAVLATINPIEQTNKARDAKFKNDAAEVLSSYERYYAAQQAYPWNLVGTTVSSGSYVTNSTSVEFGIIGRTDVPGAGETIWPGTLVVTSELKSAFVGKEPFRPGTTRAEDLMYVYHNGSDSNYVCFCPKANANRTGALQANLKCLGAAAITNQSGALCASMPSTTTNFCGLGVGTSAFLQCVPEGTLN